MQGTEDSEFLSVRTVVPMRSTWGAQRDDRVDLSYLRGLMSIMQWKPRRALSTYFRTATSEAHHVEIFIRQWL